MVILNKSVKKDLYITEKAVEKSENLLTKYECLPNIKIHNKTI